MLRFTTVSVCLLLLLCGLCTAQNDISQNDTDDPKRRYPFSLGMAFGIALPFGNRGAGSDDPIHLLDSAGTYNGSFVLTAAWRITDRLTVEGVLDLMQVVADTTLAEHAASLYTDDYILTHDATPFVMAVMGFGLSYRIPLYRRELSLEPGLLAGNLSVGSIRWSVLLKEPGTNLYRGIDRVVEGTNRFTLIPTLMLRYTFLKGTSRWGLQLRSAYYYGSANLPHSFTNHELAEEPVTATDRRDHRFDGLNIGLGLYCRLF